MKVDAYLRHVPVIEEMLAALKPDAIVFGVGPTGFLLPWLNQSLLSGVRLWGAHDAFSVMACDDLCILDPPKLALHPDTHRGATILASRPKRIWLHEPVKADWLSLLNPAVHPIVQLVKWKVWNPAAFGPQTPFPLGGDPLLTYAVSPLAATQLAWREGCRRIGVIGADMMAGHHISFNHSNIVDYCFAVIADQAKQQGGAIWNLSPVSSLGRFIKLTKQAWKPSTSGSAPTDGSNPPEPNSSSNTPSESTPPAQ